MSVIYLFDHQRFKRDETIQMVALAKTGTVVCTNWVKIPEEWSGPFKKFLQTYHPDLSDCEITGFADRCKIVFKDGGPYNKKYWDKWGYDPMDPWQQVDVPLMSVATLEP